LLVRVDNGGAEAVCRGLVRRFRAMPAALRKTLTYDRGREMSRHEEVTRRTQVKIYFADPQSPWQRGSNENINGLLRQYLPKNMDLSVLSQAKLNSIATSHLKNQLNGSVMFSKVFVPSKQRWESAWPDVKN
jgi:IS30 family transposase